jgi:hypothetical protein
MLEDELVTRKKQSSEQISSSCGKLAAAPARGGGVSATRFRDELQAITGVEQE